MLRPGVGWGEGPSPRRTPTSAGRAPPANQLAQQASPEALALPPTARPRDWAPGQGSRLDWPLACCCRLGVLASVGETPQFKSHIPRTSLSEMCSDSRLYPSLSLPHWRPSPPSSETCFVEEILSDSRCFLSGALGFQNGSVRG